MDILRSFNEFIAAERLFSRGDKLLAAVSGGVDSVVLCELLHRTGYSFRIAHCNFQLRGEESERDEQFVRMLALKYGVELSVRRFDTTGYAAEQKVSVQVAARELRYAWFRKIAEEAFIVTAHHLDDNIETLLMNFFKGTGMAGLHGILPGYSGLVRPLLFVSKERLRQFASDEALDWVEDSSNQSDKYTRNFLRHQVIPLIERVYPDAMGNLGDNIARFREVEMLYRQSVDRQKGRLMERKGEEVHIPVLKLRRSAPLNTLIYEIIHEFGFSPGQVADTVRLLDSDSGKFLLSATHRILKHRNWLIISPIRSEVAANILIEGVGEPGSHNNNRIRFAGGELTVALLQAKDADDIEAGKSVSAAAKSHEKRMIEGRVMIPGGLMTSSHVALLDAGEIRFPLLLRKWRQGDYFYPLGMRKKKKVGRFLIDNKLSRADKEKVWVI
jgi:tRNA(Ile)-lysidine synthase